ncbi:MFS transporter [Lacticaseibacillus yichunensis]|uniref:MFS transporter n=2 Tax=Bacilli TaxID=91061 RepID=A0ABW4CNX3_9LACO|nr:MFS transporter [Lacticaseibacillus yichunensis]
MTETATPKRFDAQIVKLLILRFAGTFGSGMLSFAIGLYILRRTGSALSMGISLITGPLVAVVLTPFVGYVVDTMAHRKIMIAAQITTSLGLLAFALVFHAWPAQYYPELIGLIIVLQITDNFLGTALTASLIQLFPTSRLQQVNSLNQSISSLATFLAPILGALVYTVVSIDVFALIEIGFELVELACIMLLKFQPVATEGRTDMPDPTVTPAPAPDPDPAPRESVWANFRTGFHYLANQRLMLLLSLSSAAINFFFASLNVGLPYLLVHTLKLSNPQYGVTDAGFAVGMFAGGLLLSVLHFRHHPILISFRFIALMGGLLMLNGLPLLFHWPNAVNVLFYLALNVASGVMVVLINTPIGTLMQQLIPADLQGRVFSLQGMMSTLLNPVGTLFFGMLFDRIAAGPIFGVTGLILVSLTLTIIAQMSREKLLERPENQVPEPAAESVTESAAEA